ncbi:Vacuolar fusion protein mon1b [Rhizophlyctis rosea]|uniref:Vacuolar fusion protein MON1 n=1 Tax=Rhizophlyctis rosea TaxID=64517 RepID=A0AAD5SLH8_9FUNG|nr:Vacuolar fusion protein mon1b [Rhizophlyctis rosea]
MADQLLEPGTPPDSQLGLTFSPFLSSAIDETDTDDDIDSQQEAQPQGPSQSSPTAAESSEEENGSEPAVPIKGGGCSPPLQPDDLSQDNHFSTRASTSTSLARSSSVRNAEHGEEDPTSGAWTKHRKHFFILSSAGKPIYSRHGDESKLSTFMGVVQAIWSFFASEDDSIRCLTAGKHKFVFSAKGPLYLLAVSSIGESEIQLRNQLQYLYSQILFILTSAQLTKIFETRNNYDLRNLISGTETFLDELCNRFQRTSGYFLGGIECLKMPSKLRMKIGDVLSKDPPKDLLFGMLVAREKLVTLIRPKRYSLTPSDLHLIINMINSSTSFRSVESWTPICLPKFNNRQFLHTYICFLGEDLCLVLLSQNRDAFFELSEYKSRIVEGLESTGIVDGIMDALNSDPYHIFELGIPAVRHFVFKSKLWVQYSEPGVSAPYTDGEEYRRLLREFQYSMSKLHSREVGARTVFHVTGSESILSLATQQYELFAAFSPLITSSSALAAATEIQKWIKKNEDSLFISSAPVF